ncbi:Flp pilus assembly protein CpaB [Sulfobacillus harzensis]|uniref:Flp pilus assembly protein CpaB n=1 Tax=Sulfobacillus harzensis TaxID=2729629 RepID=A0A7Y0Q4B0_9FIRM|nr:Flp pilus assembly protein CpaB [Sulfobacillus harzensis]NMP24437.1 Flp pilus assembly protein CpaB [Sulfobacillus harzensis]
MVAKERVGSFLRVNRWLIVSLAALAAALYLSTQYLQTLLANPSASSTAVPETTLVVARTAIPAYSVVTASELMTERLPTADLPSGALTQIASAVGQWTTEAIQPGVAVVASDVFQPKSANILAARIQPGDMAVDLPLSATSVVDGMVEPGDTVSLFATISEKNGQQATEDFLNGIKVLAVNGSFTPAAQPTIGQNLTLILALPPDQIAQLLFMQQKSPIEAVLDAPNAKTAVPKPFDTSQWQQPTS